MNKAHQTTIKDRIKNAFAALRGKPHHSMTLGIEVKRCSECDHEERRRGEWEKRFYNPEAKMHVYRCSACFYSCYHGFEAGPIWAYCPNCGARMEEAPSQ